MSGGTINPAWLDNSGGGGPSINQPPIEPPLREAARYPAHYQADGSFKGHMLSVQMRLSAQYGGVDNGPIVTCSVLNDTGATVGSIYRSDWNQINVNNVPPQSHVEVVLANGATHVSESVIYEMRLISFAADGSVFKVSPWLVDQVILMDDPQPGDSTDRLSGDAIRRNLWFLTTPLNGNNFLYVATGKDAMMRLISGAIRGLAV